MLKRKHLWLFLVSLLCALIFFNFQKSALPVVVDSDPEDDFHAAFKHNDSFINRSPRHGTGPKYAVHISGFHHSGTGIAREIVQLGFVDKLATVHQDVSVEQSEGQHLQTVFSPLKFRNRETCATKNLYLAVYTCPSNMNLVNGKNAKRLYDDWMRYWSVTSEMKYYIQKTPSFDINFLDQITLKTKSFLPIHVIIIGHPVHWHFHELCPNKHRKARLTDTTFIRCTIGWLHVWLDTLSTLLKNGIKSYAVIRYDYIVFHKAKAISLIKDYIESQSQFNPNENIPTRRLLRKERILHVRDGEIDSSYLWNNFYESIFLRCKKNTICFKLMNYLERYVNPLGFSLINSLNAESVDYVNNNLLRQYTSNFIMFSNENPPSSQYISNLTDVLHFVDELTTQSWMPSKKTPSSDTSVLAVKHFGTHSLSWNFTLEANYSANNQRFIELFLS